MDARDLKVTLLGCLDDLERALDHGTSLGMQPLLREDGPEGFKGRRSLDDIGAVGLRLRWPRWTVERLMGELGLEGVRRGKPRKTTTPQETTPGRLIWWSGTSPRPDRTSCGWQTSPNRADGSARSCTGR